MSEKKHKTKAGFVLQTTEPDAEYINNILHCWHSGKSYKDNSFCLDIYHGDSDTLHDYIGVPRASIKSDLSKMITVINKHMMLHYQTFESAAFISDLSNALREYNWTKGK